MKTFSILSFTLGLALVAASCNNSPGTTATPVDSTNSTGQAPVQYNGSVESSQTDSTMQSHPIDQATRQNNNANATIGAGSSAPTSTSNTSDSSTTSGSATPSKK